MKTTVRFLSIALAALVAAACAPGRPEAEPVNGAPLAGPETETVNLEQLVGAHIEDLLVLVFPEGRAEAAWAQLFNQATRYSQLRSRNRRILASADLDTMEDELASNIAEIQALLTDLYSRETVYFLNFGAAAGCSFMPGPLLRCQGAVAMDQGFPHVGSAVEVTYTTRNGREISQALRLSLHNSASQEPFHLTLTLVPQLDDGAVVYKGEVRVATGSRFTRDGQSFSAHPYGYAELRLTR